MSEQHLTTLLGQGFLLYFIMKFNYEVQLAMYMTKTLCTKEESWDLSLRYQSVPGGCDLANIIGYSCTGAPQVLLRHNQNVKNTY